MNILRLLALLALPIAFAACKPSKPDKDQPPEPKAEQATELRDTIQRPINRAKAVESQVLDAKAQQDAAIEAQTGGDPSAPPQPQN
jgi:hypothetical protein